MNIKHKSILVALGVIAAANTNVSAEPAKNAANTTRRHNVYVISEGDTLNRMALNEAQQRYATNAIGDNGVAIGRRDPVLLQALKEQNLVIENSNPINETAYNSKQNH